MSRGGFPGGFGGGFGGNARRDDKNTRKFN